jgi:hypothetical protein
MRIFIAFYLLLIAGISARSQSQPDGLWFAGAIITPAPDSGIMGKKVRLEKQLIEADLYPGFTVVKSTYELLNADTALISIRFFLRDSGHFNDAATGRIQAIPAAKIKIMVNDMPVKSTNVKNPPGLEFDISIPANKTISLKIYQLTQNNQARLIREGESRNGNAFACSFSTFFNLPPIVNTVMVRFMDPLTLTNVLGVSPMKKTFGDLHHLIYEPAMADNVPLLIWYEGAPADFKFQKNILPNADLLFHEMDKFPDIEFNIESFSGIDRYNFSTNPKNPFATILYFFMFFVPWIILGAFIIFLIKKPRKKSIPDH